MSIFRSSLQVVYCCMWCSALGVVAVVLRSRCVVLGTVCEFVSDTNSHTVLGIKSAPVAWREDA